MIKNIQKKWCIIKLPAILWLMQSQPQAAEHSLANSSQIYFSDWPHIIWNIWNNSGQLGLAVLAVSSPSFLWPPTFLIGRAVWEGLGLVQALLNNN